MKTRTCYEQHTTCNGTHCSKWQRLTEHNLSGWFLDWNGCRFELVRVSRKWYAFLAGGGSVASDYFNAGKPPWGFKSLNAAKAWVRQFQGGAK